MKQNLIIKCCHQEKDRLRISPKFSLCYKCSSAFIKNEKSNIEIFTIKPQEYSLIQENSIPIPLLISNNNHSYSFKNKHDYIKIRIILIKQMKLICNYLNLNKKTYFLSLEYFDRICSKMVTFDFEALKQIFQYCIILASKFQETGEKNLEIKKFMCGKIDNYSEDELYLLRLLDYDLHAFTSYDILMDFLHFGFLFSSEKFSIKRMNIIYSKIEEILYLFSENKYYIDMTPKDIALSIIGLIREILGLIPYNNIIINAFMNKYNDLQYYLQCLNKLKKCFKINYKNMNNNCENSSNNSEKILKENIDKYYISKIQSNNFINKSFIKEKDAIIEYL